MKKVTVVILKYSKSNYKGGGVKNRMHTCIFNFIMDAQQKISFILFQKMNTLIDTLCLWLKLKE